MKTKLQITNPDKIEATISITMPLKEWKELHATLPRVWPSCDLIYAIDELILKANQTFYQGDN